MPHVCVYPQHNCTSQLTMHHQDTPSCTKTQLGAALFPHPLPRQVPNPSNMPNPNMMCRQRTCNAYLPVHQRPTGRIAKTVSTTFQCSSPGCVSSRHTEALRTLPRSGYSEDHSGCGRMASWLWPVVYDCPCIVVLQDTECKTSLMSGIFIMQHAHLWSLELTPTTPSKRITTPLNCTAAQNLAQQVNYSTEC